jgi:hypothetical protein
VLQEALAQRRNSILTVIDDLRSDFGKVERNFGELRCDLQSFSSLCENIAEEIQ